MGFQPMSHRQDADATIRKIDNYKIDMFCSGAL
jgi:hypothetical protein